MKITILYEQKKYITEMKQNFTKENIINSMRKLLGHDDNQRYNLWDENYKLIKYGHTFYIDNLPNEITLILMKIPQFKNEEPLFNDNIIDDLSNVLDDPFTFYDIMDINPINHGNPEKKRENGLELISNIQGDFRDLPDLEKETTRK